MMLHLLLVLPLLLLVVGINAELLRGTSHEHPEKRNLGNCLCTILCQQCELQGSDMAQCQTSCAYSKEPDCSDLCDDAFHQGNWQSRRHLRPSSVAGERKQHGQLQNRVRVFGIVKRRMHLKVQRGPSSWQSVIQSMCLSVLFLIWSLSFHRWRLDFLIFNIFHVHSSIWCAYRHKSDA